jgi:hypothetical protein
MHAGLHPERHGRFSPRTPEGWRSQIHTRTILLPRGDSIYIPLLFNGHQRSLRFSVCIVLLRRSRQAGSFLQAYQWATAAVFAAGCVSHVPKLISAS